MVKLKENELFKISQPLDVVFVISLIFKGLDGLIELLGGLALLVFSQPHIRHFVTAATHQELIEDPHDFIANLLIKSTANFTDGLRYFLAVYLLIHAAVKLISVIGIITNRLWAYPFALITLGLLALYQIYEVIFVKATVVMIALTIFDIFILWMIAYEYQHRRKKLLAMQEE
jgi:uncharacterized membrane protein